MGDVADLMMDGVLCCECGTLIDDEADGFDGADGIPRYCKACGGRPEMNGQRPSSPPRRGHRKRKKT